jgi:hypothetical protein
MSAELADLRETKRLQEVITTAGGGTTSMTDEREGGTLTNDWDMLRATNPTLDATVANSRFSVRWEPGEAMAEDNRSKWPRLRPDARGRLRSRVFRRSSHPQPCPMTSSVTTRR